MVLFITLTNSPLTSKYLRLEDKPYIVASSVGPPLHNQALHHAGSCFIHATLTELLTWEVETQHYGKAQVVIHRSEYLKTKKITAL